MNFAGNSKKLSTNFCEVLEGVWAYIRCLTRNKPFNDSCADIRIFASRNF